MLTGRKISVKAIIDGVLAITEYDSTDIKPGDIVEWVADAMDKIGVPMAMEERKATDDGKDYLTVTDYKGFLPKDCNDILAVRDYNTKASFTYSTNDFHTSKSHIENMSNGFAQNLTYKYNNTCIFTSLKNCKLEVIYRAYPIDEHGYPLVPEETRYKEAIKWYLMYMLDYRAWRKGIINEKVYRTSEQEWLFYSGSAATKALMPSVDQMESWKNLIVRIIPVVDEHDTNFRTLGEEQERFNNTTNTRYNI